MAKGAMVCVPASSATGRSIISGIFGVGKAHKKRKTTHKKRKTTAKRRKRLI